MPPTYAPNRFIHLQKKTKLCSAAVSVCVHPAGSPDGDKAESSRPSRFVFSKKAGTKSTTYRDADEQRKGCREMRQQADAWDGAAK